MSQLTRTLIIMCGIVLLTYCKVGLSLTNTVSIANNWVMLNPNNINSPSGLNVTMDTSGSNYTLKLDIYPNNKNTIWSGQCIQTSVTGLWWVGVNGYKLEPITKVECVPGYTTNKNFYPSSSGWEVIVDPTTITDLRSLTFQYKLYTESGSLVNKQSLIVSDSLMTLLRANLRSPVSTYVSPGIETTVIDPKSTLTLNVPASVDAVGEGIINIPYELNWKFIDILGLTGITKEHLNLKSMKLTIKQLDSNLGLYLITDNGDECRINSWDSCLVSDSPGNGNIRLRVVKPYSAVGPISSNVQIAIEVI
ncbi:TPA: hypothetical protein MYR83_004052 [Escherichia coli]|nr:hypothetical protein [Escherichia coli]